MVSKYKLLSVWLIVICLARCSTTLPFQKLPQTQDAFQKSPDQIRQEYPEITEYEKFRGIFFINTPYAEYLVTQWGEPNKIEKQWSYFGIIGAVIVGGAFVFGPIPAIVTGGIAVTIRPYGGAEHYFWEKGNYRIEAVIDRTIIDPYKKRMLQWKWHESHLSKK